MRLFRHGAQSLIEYVTLISVVTMALTVLFPLVKRAVQSVVRTGAAQIGSQPKADTGGATSITNVAVDSSPATRYAPGQVSVIDNDRVSSNTITTTNMQ